MKKIKVNFIILFLYTFQFCYSNESRLKLEKYLFPEKKSFINTQAFLIYKNNNLVYEHYAQPYNSDTKYLSWSMAKTVTGILIGIAEQENILKRSDTIGSIIPNLPPLKSSIKVSDLLQMSSGIKFTELYFGNIWKYDVHSMLFKNGTKDVGRFVLQLPMSYKPGERFYYSSGDTNLLMYLLKKKISKEDYNSFPYVKLFKPLGIESATFEQDESGTFLGSSFLYLKVSDFAKLGQFILNKGKVGNNQILKSEFVDYMSTLTPSFLHKDNIDTFNGYGAQLWLNYVIDSHGNKKPVYPSLPLDTVFFQGIKGQLIGIIPSEKIVFVRIALDDDPGIHKDYYFSLLMNFLKPTNHLPHEYSNEPLRESKEKNNIDSRIIEEGKIDPEIGLNHSFLSFLELGNKFTARMVCSCHFVQKLEINYCEKLYSRYTYIFHSSFEKQPDNSINISVYNLFGKGNAKFRNDLLGCNAF